MADDGTIRYDVEGHVARVTIDRPERRNALTWGLSPTCGPPSPGRAPTPACGCAC